MHTPPFVGLQDVQHYSTNSLTPEPRQQLLVPTKRGAIGTRNQVLTKLLSLILSDITRLQQMYGTLALPSLEGAILSHPRAQR